MLSAQAAVASLGIQFTPLLAGGGLIELAIVFVILAIIAAIFGARGIAGMTMGIAKWLIIIFLVLAIITYFF